MKHLFSLIYLVCITASTHLFGEIIETKHFHEITNHVTPSCLVILDIDDTLLIPKQTLGTDAWFLDRAKCLIDQEMTKEEAFMQAVREWEAIRKITKVEIVEEGIDSVIQNLQKNAVAVMGLTTQGLTMIGITPSQLLSLNINLKNTAPYEGDYYFCGERGVLYTQGILFTYGTAKGEALLSLLKHINLSPNHIIFINDKLSHLKDVEISVEKQNIKFTGLRYSYSDERVANYSREIANIQMEMSNFEHILSDDEAKEIALKKESIFQ